VSWRELHKLLFGETWVLPIGIAVAIGAAALIETFAGAWWTDAGGFVVLGLVGIAVTVATLPARRP